jgi:hypothetical protein
LGVQCAATSSGLEEGVSGRFYSIANLMPVYDCDGVCFRIMPIIFPIEKNGYATNWAQPGIDYSGVFYEISTIIQYLVAAV